MSKFFKPFQPLALTVSWLAATVLVASCSTPSPYQRPEAALAPAWPSADPASASAAPPDWQSYFTPPPLRQLINTALAHNRDLRLARLNIEQARAQLGLRQADQWPTLNLAAAGTRAPTSAGAISSSYSAGLALAAYELDFFGRVAGLQEQALAQYLASDAAAQSAQISLIATVAQSWLSLQADLALLEISRQTLAAREQSLQLVALKLQHGAASELEHQLAQSLLQSTRVTLAQQTRQRALDENTLVLLLGQPLDAASRSQLSQTMLGQLTFAELPAGLPSDLLTRRPDLRQAEQLLIASHANIDAARAAFFPRISLTAGVGSASSALSGLFASGAWGWTLAPQLLLPIFDSGRSQANLDGAQASRDMALAQYEKAIQSAFREVADALASRASLQQQLLASTALLEAENQRARLTQLRLDHGAASQLEWLEAQRAQFAAQQALVLTRLAYLQNQVALFKALGGGASISILGTQRGAMLSAISLHRRSSSSSG